METYATKKLSVQVCNHHLQELYAAIEQNDLNSIYALEHTLTQAEECVVCAYALKAKGEVRTALDLFLRQQGFDIDTHPDETVLSEVEFWVTRIAVLVLLFLGFSFLAAHFKSYINNANFTFAISSFGWVGIFLITLATFVLVEYEFLE